jgi:hypothetical protein
MIYFLSHDFNNQRWRQAALKNAYALIGRQRFEYAAAFFILAGRKQEALRYVPRNSITAQVLSSSTADAVAL